MTINGNAPAASDSVFVNDQGDADAHRLVRVFDGTNLALPPLYGFQPYSTQFGDSVRVAVIDINGDGEVEVVTAGGPGGSALPKVFDFTPAPDEVDNFFTVPPNLPGGFYLGAGG